MRTSNTIEGYVPLSQKISYSISCAGGNLVSTVISMFVSAYMTDSVGVAAATVGTMMLISRFLDLGTDFIVGSLVDKTHTKYGKTRPWILASAPLVCLFMFMFFSTPMSWSLSGKVVYCCILYLLVNAVSFTIFVIPHTALLSRITLNAIERQKIASMSQILNQVAAILVVMFFVPMVSLIGYRWTALAYGILAAVMIAFGFFGTKEMIDDNSENDSKKNAENQVPFKKAICYIAKNKYFWLELMLFCLTILISSSSLTVSYYYCAYIFNDPNKVGILSVCTVIPAVIMNMFLAKFIEKFGRKRILVLSAIGILVSCIIMGIFSNSIVIVCAMYGVKGFFMGGLFACCYALSGDVIDYNEWKYGVRTEGLVNAGVSIGQKLGVGLGPAIATWILGVGGYDGLVATQTASALRSISFSFSYLSAIFAGIMIFVGLAYDMDKYSAQMQRELTAKHKSASDL